MKTPDLHLPSRARIARGAAAWLAGLVCGSAIAATTDIANAPLFTSSNTTVKPNMMFILDDSGSMEREYMPDEAYNFDSVEYGKTASQCNGLAYDPNVTYTVPKNADGTSKSNGDLNLLDVSDQVNNERTLSSIATWPSAGASISLTVTGGSPQSNWYSTSPGNSSHLVTIWGSDTQFFTGRVTGWNKDTRALQVRVLAVVGSGSASSPRVGHGLANSYFTYTGSQGKLNFSYNSSGDLTANTFYNECNSDIGDTPGSNVFTAGAVGQSSTDAQNYANWKTYYTDRMKMMKTAVSLAFAGVDSRYRVGFSTISSRTAAASDGFLDIADFDATQKTSFYTKLFAASPSITTPLRGALAKAGQYYAKKAPSQTVDPIQYSCQRNFTILSTDGYWNTGYETTTYGPYKLDGTAVGQQDGGGTLRPMFDGGSVTVTTTETWTVTTRTVTVTDTPKVTTSTTTNSTTTFNPTSREERTSYELATRFNINGADLVRSGNVVTITVDGGHGLVNGDRIDVTGGSNSYRVDGVLITVLSPTRFRYTDNRSNGDGGWRNTYTIHPGGSQCTGSKGVARPVVQTLHRGTNTTFSTITTSVVASTVTVTTDRTERVPYSRVTRVVNGVQVSDNTTAGTMTVLANTSTTNTVTGTPSTTTTNTTTGPVAADTGWATTSATAVTGGSCVSSVPAPLPETTGLPPTSGQTQDWNTVTNETTVTGTPIVSQTRDATESAHTTTTSSATSGGTSNTLADVAMYYYQTDLRDGGLSNCTGALGTNVCANNVSGNTDDAAHSYGDSATWQHMTTFTLGLGASGFLKYDPNYLTQLSGDFFDITNSSRDWSTPTVSSSGGGPENIDDLWHAAVNGRGQYFSATDPNSLTDSLNAALDKIKAVTGAASAASTSSLQPVAGDNDIYVAQFTTQLWVGDVLKFTIDPLTGAISTSPTWSAKTQLDTQTAASRRILYAKPDGTSALRDFTYANLSADGYGANFTGFCSKAGADGGSSPSQCADLNSAELTSANTGTNLVNFLRGDRTATYYRTRQNLLGDIINASPLYIGKPGFRYTENNYQAFASSNAGRRAVVLAAANDGMLHAFDRATGNELWAFIPSFVMPNLYKLADNSYSNNHHYFVDGSPQVGDIYVGGQWKTIVVGGLNAGGRGYYALDVTDPENPTLLWEFRHDNLGLTFGNPIITKQADGTWIVAFGSGYNNVSPGDGNGHLFVLNAATGAPIKTISTFTSGTTAAGSTGTPSGLARINVWVDSELVNEAKRFYGGDLLGNLWRFDIDGLVAPNNSALLLAQLTSTDGSPQPITVKPTLAEVNYNGSRYPVVYVATGKYLGTTDLSDARVQSIYAMKDPLTGTGYGVVRSDGNFATQTITASGTNRTSTSNAVNWTTKSGWRADLPAGERVSVNPQIALETLFVGSNLPSNDSCTVGGQSFLYEFNIASGSSTSTYVGNVMIQGLTLVQLTEGAAAGSVVSIITRSDGTLQSIVGSPSTTTMNLKRTSWRELVD